MTCKADGMYQVSSVFTLFFKLMYYITGCSTLVLAIVLGKEGLRFGWMKACLYFVSFFGKVVIHSLSVSLRLTRFHVVTWFSMTSPSHCENGFLFQGVGSNTFSSYAQLFHV